MEELYKAIEDRKYKAAAIQDLYRAEMYTNGICRDQDQKEKTTALICYYPNSKRMCNL